MQNKHLTCSLFHSSDQHKLSCVPQDTWALAGRGGSQILDSDPSRHQASPGKATHERLLYMPWTEQGLRDPGQQKTSSLRKSRRPPAHNSPAVCVIVQLHDCPAVSLQGGVVVTVPVDVPQHWGQEQKGKYRKQTPPRRDGAVLREFNKKK